MPLFISYVRRFGGDDMRAAYALARDLMRGDPAQFKAGYTADNALLSVLDAARIDGVHLSVQTLALLPDLLGMTDETRRKQAIVATLRTMPTFGVDDEGFQELGEEIAQLCHDYGTFQDLDDEPGAVDPDYANDPYHWHMKLRRARNSCERFFDVLNQERDRR